ncbi:MAG: hypothetical protein SVM80_02255 [Halobacteriota archaeon]|nr:hypothetical protein [Halobacteriota archaeon]
MGDGRKEIIKTLFGIEEDEIANAWDLNIDFIRSVMDTSMSRREKDMAERRLLKHIKKHHLEMLDNEDGLCTHEVAIAKSIEDARPFDSFDVVLVNEFEDVCRALIVDDIEEQAAFLEAVIKLLRDVNIPPRLKRRLIEIDEVAGERVLKAVLRDHPAEPEALNLLIDLYDRCGRTQEIEGEFELAISASDSCVIRSMYGDFLEREERYEESLKAFEWALESPDLKNREDLEDDIKFVNKVLKMSDEEKEVVKAFEEGSRMMGKIQEFALSMEDDLLWAMEEYNIFEETEEEYSDVDKINFLNFFAFEWKISDGRTPAIVYIGDNDIMGELRTKILNLENNIESIFEIIKTDHEKLRITVKDIIGEETYEVVGDVSDVREGQVFKGKIFPWDDIYLTGGLIAAYDAPKSKEIKERFKETVVMQKDLHGAFVEYFGAYDPVFNSRRECEKAFEDFFRWQTFEWIVPEDGKTPAELHKDGLEKYSEKLLPELPSILDEFNDIGIISDPKFGIGIIPSYSSFKKIFEEGEGDDEELDLFADMLFEVEPFIIKRLMQENPGNTVKLINTIFEDEEDLGADMTELEDFMRQLRDDWDERPFLTVSPVSGGEYDRDMESGVK